MANRRSTTPSGKAVWAYAYHIEPPQAAGRLRAIKVLLDRERAAAREEARRWESRLVAEDHVTHILVVSDSPDQDREVNRRVEAALRELEFGFSVTAPMAVEDESSPPWFSD